MKATVASKVYGMILANPGITTREINRQMNLTGNERQAVHSAVHSLVKRGAVKAKPCGERNTKYYKGSAPAVLRQPQGQTQKKLDKDIEVANIIAAMEAGIEAMLKEFKRKLEAA